MKLITSSATSSGTGDFKADGTVPMTGKFLADSSYSVSTPEVSKNGDANTGVGFPAANTIGLITDGVERHRVDGDGTHTVTYPTGSTLAAAFFVRAYVKFDGTTLSTVAGTYSRTGTTVTVTATAHGHQVGHHVFLDFTSGTATDGLFTVDTVADANTFTIVHGTSGSTSGNVNLNRLSIYGSGGIHSVYRTATGQYSMNLTTAMPDTNGVCIPTCGAAIVGGDMNNQLIGGNIASTLVAIARSQNPNDGVNANVDNMQVIIVR